MSRSGRTTMVKPSKNIALEGDDEDELRPGSVRSPRQRSKSPARVRDRSPAEHLESMDARNVEGCPFVEFDCPFKGERQKVKRHMKDAARDHLENLADGLSGLHRMYVDFEDVYMHNDRLLEDIEHRAALLKSMFSSQLVWRIDHFRSLFNDAKIGKKPTVFSPPFYSAKHGYKLAASLALYGDGPVKGSHASVFLSILKGDNDSLLQWPFSNAVIFTLVDQDKKQDVVQILKANTCKENRPFVGRPLGDRNPSFGIQKFVELTTLRGGGYIKDDTLFIRVDVDNSDVLRL